MKTYLDKRGRSHGSVIGTKLANLFDIFTWPPKFEFDPTEIRFAKTSSTIGDWIGDNVDNLEKFFSEDIPSEGETDEPVHVPSAEDDSDPVVSTDKTEPTDNGDGGHDDIINSDPILAAAVRELSELNLTALPTVNIVDHFNFDKVPSVLSSGDDDNKHGIKRFLTRLTGNKTQRGS